MLFTANACPMGSLEKRGNDVSFAKFQAEDKTRQREADSARIAAFLEGQQRVHSGNGGRSEDHEREAEWQSPQMPVIPCRCFRRVQRVTPEITEVCM